MRIRTIDTSDPLAAAMAKAMGAAVDQTHSVQLSGDVRASGTAFLTPTEAEAYMSGVRDACHILGVEIEI